MASPRILHHLCAAPRLLEESLEEELALEKAEARRLLDWGAVYRNHRRAREGERVEAGDYLRVHREPKRYRPVGGQWALSWEVRDACVVAEKPAGIPVHPTLDNRRENLQAWLERELGFALFTTTRLDVPTQGLVVFARTREFARHMHGAAHGQALVKHYRALTRSPVAPGPYRHYMAPGNRSPRTVVAAPETGHKECLLEVTRCRPWPLPLPDGGRGYEVGVRLGTGRTHQIRAQLAALGAPLWGDTLYGDGPPEEPRWIALRAERLALPEPGGGDRQMSFSLEGRPWLPFEK